MNRFTFAISLVSWTLSVIVGSLPQIASADGIVEQIVVTARQRSELLQDVPASITAFTESDIKSARIERAEDFISLTPGVSMVDAAEVGDTQISIRGINGSRDAESNFGFIVDGVLLTNPSAFNREFSDLQQIEVLKGPQGALYGRSAAAGAIIVTTKKPTNEFESEFKASGGNEKSYFASGAASGALVKDKLFGRFNFDYRTTDGFYKNSFLDRKNVDNFETYSLNGRLVWEPNDRTSVDTRLRYSEVDAASITFNSTFNLAGLGGVSLFGVPLNQNVNTQPFKFVGNVEPGNDQESKEFSIKVDHDMDWATATGWFLYSDIEQSFVADGTSGAFGFFAAEPDCVASSAINPNPLGTAYGSNTCDGYQFQERNQEDFSIDVRLTSPDEDRLRWQAGLYYLHLEREVGVATGVDNTFSGVPVAESLFVPGVTENLLWDDFTTDVYAAYGSLAYDITPDVEAAVALRYDVEDRETSNLVPVGPFSAFINPGTGSLNPGIDVAGGAIPDREDSWDQLQPKLSLSWDATDGLTLFTSWGIGFKSGGFNNAGSAATVNTFINTPILGGPAGAAFTPVSISDTFEKEVSNSVEVGFKSVFADGRVNFEGAVYHTEVDDMQFFEFFVGGFGLLRVVNTIDEVSINGGELALSVGVNDYLTLFGSMSVVNGRIDANRSRPATVGNEVPYAPERTANLGADFNLPIRNNINFTARLDWSFVGETWFHTVQDELVPGLFTLGGFPSTDSTTMKRDSYGLINLRMGLEGSDWAVSVFGNNLLDKKYLEEVIPAPEFGGTFSHPGARRLLGVEAIYRF
jgi:iron complex outermembrane recepter protein